METKEQLIDYLESNPDTELPFLEELWVKCLELCEKNQGKNPQKMKTTTTDRDGVVTVKEISVSNVLVNPVAQYFKMISLHQYRKKAILLQDELYGVKVTSESQKEVIDLHFEAGDTDFNDEITSWIRLFKPDERNFLIKRYSSYFDQYEINEGADKTSLKRILSLEIALYRIDIKRAGGKVVDINDEKKMSELLQSTFESLKWTKKQRNARDDLAQNKFTVWMEKQVQEGGFKEVKKEYDKDEIDFLLDTIIDSTREMLS